eukprot:ANDGO_03964.mRNA.1 U1 small nuclear ribonucleoprotein C
MGKKRKYYCEYCDIHLVRGFQNARKEHNLGLRHRANVQAYYAQFLKNDALVRKLEENRGVFQQRFEPPPQDQQDQQQQQQQQREQQEQGALSAPSAHPQRSARTKPSVPPMMLPVPLVVPGLPPGSRAPVRPIPPPMAVVTEPTSTEGVPAAASESSDDHQQ